MRRTLFPDSPDDAQSDVNLTPMLDVVFIMLIFFLVVASFLKETGLDMNRSEVNQPPRSEAENILIVVDENNEIWIGNRMVDPRALRANIERLQAENLAAAVVIRAHRRSANKTFVQVMDASRQAGIYDILLAAE